MLKVSSIRPLGAVPKQGLKKRAKDEVDRRGSGYKEKDIQKQCEKVLDYAHIAYIRIPDVLNSIIFAGLKVNVFGRWTTVQVPTHIKKLISAFLKGLPDLTILSKDGRFYCVELKTTIGKLSQGQKTFCRMVGEQNFYVIRSVEGLQELIVDKGIE
jgi:hypothetical protein